MARHRASQIKSRALTRDEIAAVEGDMQISDVLKKVFSEVPDVDDEGNPVIGEDGKPKTHMLQIGEGVEIDSGFESENDVRNYQSKYVPKVAKDMGWGGNKKAVKAKGYPIQRKDGSWVLWVIRKV